MNNNPNVFMQSDIEKLPNSFYSHAEAIFHLSEVGIDVKQVRVADWLGVSSCLLYTSPSPRDLG